MGRHAKNNGAQAWWTYEEQRELKWGTQKVRVGGDGCSDVGTCSICLHECKEPLTCPNGNLYCKECIYEFLLNQKLHKKKQMEAYLQQQEEIKAEEAAKQSVGEQKQLEAFSRYEDGIIDRRTKRRKGVDELDPAPGYKTFETATGKVFVVDEDLAAKNSRPEKEMSKEDKVERLKSVPAFWIPSMTPDSGRKLIQPPTEETVCPQGNPIKLKQLIPVKFTRLGADESKNEKVDKIQTAKFMCPICQKTLTKSTKCFVVKPTGDVISEACVEIILGDGKLNGKKVRKDDIIKLNSGGTGFAAGGGHMAESRRNTEPKKVGSFW